ncbi:hypothetical protein BH09PSE2_BH09PSE2_21070 [soil metagenome]
MRSFTGPAEVDGSAAWRVRLSGFLAGLRRRPPAAPAAATNCTRPEAFDDWADKQW